MNGSNMNESEDEDKVADEELTGAGFLAGSPIHQKDVQAIAYFEESTDGNVVDSDLLRQSSDRSSDGDCDIDELADLADDLALSSPQKSPEPKAMKKPTNEVMKNNSILMAKNRHNLNLSDVLEENSSLSSGQVSVDKKFLSPDILLQK